MSVSDIGSIQAIEGEKLAVVQCVLLDENGKAISENECLYTLPKYFPFVKPCLRVECRGNQVTVSSDAYCTGVELCAGDARFSDNWFSLYPDEERTVLSDRELQKDQITLRCLSSDE